jgi:hypothetical protein
VLIRGPELMTVYRFQGDYLRLKPAIGTKLFRRIILVTAREWTRDYEFCLHPPMAEVGHQTGNHRRAGPNRAGIAGRKEEALALSPGSLLCGESIENLREFSRGDAVVSTRPDPVSVRLRCSDWPTRLGAIGPSAELSDRQHMEQDEAWHGKGRDHDRWIGPGLRYRNVEAEPLEWTRRRQEPHGVASNITPIERDHNSGSKARISGRKMAIGNLGRRGICQKPQDTRPPPSRL